LNNNKSPHHTTLQNPLLTRKDLQRRRGEEERNKSDSENKKIHKIGGNIQTTSNPMIG
jgi:hypothetical protein